jgi:hypothetical protein
LFLALWLQYGPGAKLPPQAEFTFAKPRKWRFDFAWPEHRAAVELEGGIHIGGRHTRGVGFEKDMEKYNAMIVVQFFAANNYVETKHHVSK